MNDRPIRILTVDDHAVLRDGIAALVAQEPDMLLVGEAANGAEAIEEFRRLRPDVTLMDLQMPGMSGIDAITAICVEAPKARIIVLTTYEGDAQAVRALKAGASAYLLKSSLRKELLDAIRLVHSGRRYIPAGIAQDIAIHAAQEPLTERETTILKMVAEGKANKVIAWELTLSEDTVKAHLRSIFSKLDVSDRTQAVTLALRRGIISL
ncbi:MAG: response regulator transcription factor [Pseudomonadota bacterium]|nr:response regulator transcription factor [Pseudomonadota bacterium]